MSDAADRLAAVTAALEEVGGVVQEVVPLALAEAPHELVAHWVGAMSMTREIQADVEAVLKRHHVDITGMVIWTPDPQEVTDAGTAE